MAVPRRVLFVGCGQVAARHAEALSRLAGAELSAVCDTDRQRLEEAAAWAPGARPYEDLTTALAREKPDVVHVLTPPLSHAEIAVQALESGAHVLVEKPMAVSCADAERMIQVARSRGLRLAVNHGYLNKPSVRRARALVASGAVGEVLHVDAFYGVADDANISLTGAEAHWSYRLPGGMFTNFLPHLLYLHRAFGGDLQAVDGVSLDGASGASPSELVVLLRGQRATGTLTVSLRARPYAKWVAVRGTRGTVHIDLAAEVCVVRRARAVPGLVSRTLLNLEDAGQLVVGTLRNAANVATGRLPRMPELTAFLGELYEALSTGDPLPASGQDGWHVARGLELIRHATPAASTTRPTPGSADHDRPRSGPERQFAEVHGGRSRVMVTGASGFLGAHLVAALHRSGVEVIALVRDEASVPRGVARSAALMRGNLYDPATVARAVEGADLVLHCAAQTRAAASPAVHRAVNVEGTRVVLEAAERAGVRRLVHASSIVVYGFGRPSAQPLREDAPYASEGAVLGPYAATKIEADRLALRFHEESPLSVAVLRLGMLFGPQAERRVTRALLSVGRAEVAIGTGRNVLPYTYVENAVDCFLLAALAQGADGRAYNVVDDGEVTVRAARQLRDDLLGARTYVVSVPPAILEPFARIAERRAGSVPSAEGPRLSRFAIRSATRDLRYDCTAARADLGWHPRIGFEEALRRTLGLSPA